MVDVTPDKAEATFNKVSDGLEFKLWASEPLFVNPTSMDIDHLGRVWVCEAVNYRQILRGQPVLRPEGDRILKFLYDHCGRDEWVFRFRWRPHSIAFWDNRCAHHKAIWDYWPNVRSGYRVQVEGTAPPVAG